MQRNTLLGTVGFLVSTAAMVAGFHLSFWVFYPSHHAEDISSLVLIAVIVASIVVSIVGRFRAMGFGMITGCVIGLIVLGASLWGA